MVSTIYGYNTFVLGMHFCQAIAIIQSQVGIIKGVQVLYSDKVHSTFFYGVIWLGCMYFIILIL